MADFDFSFMWNRQSQVIGEGIEKSDSKLSDTLARHDAPGAVAKAKGEGLYPMTEEEKAADVSNMYSEPPKPDIEHILGAYNHKPRGEHPM